jgi:CheY-like chemotaxis protein
MKGTQHLLPSTPDQPVVLFVDDEVVLVTTARIALERDGYFVLTAENGAEALELSRKFPGPIHALVTDIRMPKMDGIELRRHIVAERPGTKVLLTSGFVDLPVHGCPFLPKPFCISVLKDKIRHLLVSSSDMVITTEMVRSSAKSRV